MAKSEHFKIAAKLKTPTAVKFSPKRRQSKQAPEPLAEIIRLVNLVPKERLPPLDLVPLDGELPPPPAGDWPKDFSFHQWVVKSDRETLQKWLDHRLKGLPEEFKDYITQGHKGSDALWFFRTLYRYELVRQSRRKLRDIVRAVYEAERTRHLPTHPYPGVFVDESWIIRKADDEFDVALFGNDKAIDAREIRRCEICDRIFFARRIDSKVCDPYGKCAVTLAKRNERANARIRARLNELKARKGKRK